MYRLVSAGAQRYFSGRPIAPRRYLSSDLVSLDRGTRRWTVSTVTCNITCMAVRDRVGAHRARMREKGFRIVQMWVPDVRSERFAEEAHRQSLVVGSADRLTDDQAFIEAVSVDWDE